MTVQETSLVTKTCPTQVCSITMWKEEYSLDQWQELVQAPVKYAKQTLGHEMGQAIINPWARSYKQGKDAVRPEDAHSVQFHCEIHQEQLPAILRVSGYNKLHMTPKTAEGTPSPHYAVVWLPGTMQELQAKAAMLPGHAGFVRAPKKHGVRFEVSAFEAAWKQLRPNETVPDLQTYPHVFRLQPLPYGVDAMILKTWAQNANWQIKPLKNQGPGKWIVAAMQEPPTTWLLFNGKPILIQQLPPKSNKPYKALVIGSKVSQTTQESNQEEPKVINKFRMGDPHYDPWGAARQKQSDAASDSQPSTSTVTGPTAQALQVQDQRIASLEQKLQEAQESQKDHQTKVDGKLLDMERNIQDNHNAQRADLESLRQDFKATFREAATRQQDSLQTALLEFKMLFLGQSRQRKRAKEEDEDIEEHQTRQKLDQEDSAMEDDM